MFVFRKTLRAFFSCYPRLEIRSFVWLPAVCQIVFYIMYIRLFITVRRILAWRFTSIINRKIFFFFLVNITLLHGHDKECLKIWKNCTISHVYSQYVFLFLRVFNNGCSNPSFIAGPENSFIVPVIIRVYCKDFKETLKIRFR